MNTKSTAIYTRVSTTDQRTDSQEREITNFCDSRNWNKRQLYSDIISGGTFSRTGLDKLMQDVRSGRVTRLVVYKLDRLGRSLPHLALLIEELRKYNVSLIATSQGIDTSNANPAAQLQLNVLLAVAQFERGIIRERVNAGIAAAKERGIKFGRPRTLDSKSSSVQKLRESGLSLRAIGRRLSMPVSSVHRALKSDL